MLSVVVIPRYFATEHFPKFDCVVNSGREFVCDADAESLSLSDIWLH